MKNLLLLIPFISFGQKIKYFFIRVFNVKVCECYSDLSHLKLGEQWGTTMPSGAKYIKVGKNKVLYINKKP